MKTASPGLMALINNNTQFLMADLYTFTLASGLVVRYTSADADITLGSDVFQKFLIKRSRTRMVIGTAADAFDVTVSAGPGDLLDGTPWLAAARNGALDGAQVEVRRVFMPAPGDTSLGSILWVAGRVADIKVARTEAQLAVMSELELLDTQLPRNCYQSGCLNTLFDDSCTLRKWNYAVNASVTGATATQISSGLGQPGDYFTLGSIRFTSGGNNNVVRSVRGYAGGVFTLSLPLLVVPQPGDTFVAYPGCDKRKATCESKFNNVFNFRGYPFVPDPETAT